jgi:hypothetical protein
VPRGLPGSHGNVSRTRGDGLTRPAAIAAAAGRALRASRSAASMRPRNSPRGSGSTQGAGVGWTGDARQPQAYMPAKAVRTRGQLSAAAALRACVRPSRARKTRMGTGRRPRGELLGQRGAKLCAMARTSATQGKGAAHGRMGGRAGTKSVTCRRVPGPLHQCWRERAKRLAASPAAQGNENRRRRRDDQRHKSR